ncbi:MAG: VWA domain-containing protein [Planctomycetota bacterium]
MFLLSTLERFDRPEALWLALIVVLLWWFSRRSLAGLGPIRSKVCMAVRALVVVLLVLALAGAHKILKNEDLSVLFLLDQSRSIPPELRTQAEDFVMQMGKAMEREDDRLSILTFDGQTYIEQLPSRPGPDGGVHVLPPFPDGQRPDATNLSQALRMAAACALDSTNNRVVILSDGNENVGTLAEEAKTAQANNITVDVVPLRYEHGAEVVNEMLRAPAYANLHEQALVRFVLTSDRATTGTLFLYKRVGQKEEPVDLDPESEGNGKRVRLEKGRNAFARRVYLDSTGTHEWHSVFVPDDKAADAVAQNNAARAFTNIEGPKTVLFIGKAEEAEDDEPLINALIQEDIRVLYQPVDSVNLQTSVLQDYSAIILANVGADLFDAEQQRSLATYVRDLGGGLVMIGGDDSFGAGGWQGSVVESTMPVKFDVDAVKQIPRGALAIVMHSCEMPQGNKWGIETAVAALKTLSRLDYYGVVGWGAMGFHWEVSMQTASDKEAIIARLRKMQNADMFDFGTPMTMAYQALMNCRDAGQRHMIIISDGDPQAPPTGLLNKMIGHRVTCSTVSVFPHGGAEIATMKDIATKTGGTYYSLYRSGDEKRLPKIFIKEAKIVRRPLIRDEVFTPKLQSSMSDIMVGIGDDIPQLRGYVVTTPRKVVDVEMPLLTERGDPLLAHWQCGFGRTVAFTSGRWRHWGVDWVGWPSFSKLWAQAVHWCMQQGSAADYEVTKSIEGDEGHVLIECMDEKEGFANFKRFVGKVISPDGNAANLQIEQTGPGRYEAKFKADKMGTYLLNITAPGVQGDEPTVIRTGVSVAYSPEFKDVSPNEALLQEVADETEGRVLSLNTKAETLFAHNLPPTVSRTPIWDTLLKLAIFAFLLDVAVRRIAIDPLKTLARARVYIGSLAGRFGAGKRAEATLTDLKTVREKVRAERTSEGDAGALAAAGQAAKDAAAQSYGQDDEGLLAATKFDAGAQAKKPAKDIVDALGGHKGGPAGPPSAAPKKPQGPQESTTARLLKAKKRAKQAEEQEGKDGKESS